ncbi:hypothetical protein H2198_005465 [Neophaeococcomyces mojaviensis]|uniref:Uncharacterized protein n=1 Tax=Neophaeococcomyces mojaviensis TaxID=3383035 RepID=A0ACC3A5P9_9EURO|nr:hypothetical protein H2198_005465 [Knufia sp. JES_112]
MNPFLLAANTPEPDARLLPLLRTNPSLASEQDAHGYSLLHAAASYNHVDLLRTLTNEFNVDVNLRDEDNETCLFVVETVEAAKCLVEELHVNVGAQNDDGMTAREKFESEGEFPDVAAYLAQGVAVSSEIAGSDDLQNGHPPPLPPSVKLNLDTVTDQTEAEINAQEPDPEFRRRIEELASRENFHTEEGQRQLRELITDAVRDVSHDEHESQRRRVG